MEIMKIDNNSIRVFYRSLPKSAPGVCAKESDNEYIIIINSDLPDVVQAEALEHEILHIRRRDLDADYVNVDRIEPDVHREILLRKEV